ncbi:hypothetical protein AGMMS49982_11720 [Bacteroidia bacterium]|nr:hypothetical protein AGMMS49982_11720 [Bacteroidia bacterium]
MKTYNNLEAQNDVMVLNAGINESVSIKQRKNASPLDVEGIIVNISTDEVMDFIREGRENFPNKTNLMVCK